MKLLTIPPATPIISAIEVWTRCGAETAMISPPVRLATRTLQGSRAGLKRILTIKAEMVLPICERVMLIIIMPYEQPPAMIMGRRITLKEEPSRENSVLSESQSTSLLLEVRAIRFRNAEERTMEATQQQMCTLKIPAGSSTFSSCWSYQTKQYPKEFITKITKTVTSFTLSIIGLSNKKFPRPSTSPLKNPELRSALLERQLMPTSLLSGMYHMTPMKIRKDMQQTEVHYVLKPETPPIPMPIMANRQKLVQNYRLSF